MDKLLIFLGAALLYAAYTNDVDLTLSKVKLMFANKQFLKLLILFAILLSIVQYAKDKTLSNGAATIAVLIAFSHLLRDKNLFEGQSK